MVSLSREEDGTELSDKAEDGLKLLVDPEETRILFWRFRAGRLFIEEYLIQRLSVGSRIWCQEAYG